MVRKLLLIISDGGGNSPLRGVHIDKEIFLNFFKSPEGGAWKDEEINVFDENNFDLQILKATDLTARLEKQPGDFYLIVFVDMDLRMKIIKSTLKFDRILH